jgi:hypothetical protein
MRKDGHIIKLRRSHNKAGEQSVLMKEAIVNYFVERELIQ